MMMIAGRAAGCGGRAEPGTRPAQEYADAYLEARSVGDTSLSAFYDDAVRVDQGWLDCVGSGRAQFLQHLLSAFQGGANADDADGVMRESPVYLSACGVIQPVWIQSAAGFRHVRNHEVAAEGIGDVGSHPSIAMGYQNKHPWWWRAVLARGSPVRDAQRSARVERSEAAGNRGNQVPVQQAANEKGRTSCDD